MRELFKHELLSKRFVLVLLRARLYGLESEPLLFVLCQEHLGVRAFAEQPAKCKRVDIERAIHHVVVEGMVKFSLVIETEETEETEEGLRSEQSS